jgi:phosphatidylglycerophosphate synthase
LALWVVIVVFARDITVTGMRMVAQARGLSVAANGLGKAKTVLQAITVFVLLAVGSGTAFTQVLVLVMVAVTLASAFVYAAAYLGWAAAVEESGSEPVVKARVRLV